MTKRKPPPVWCVVDFGIQPPRLRCLRCETSEAINLPASVDGFVLRCKAFEADHELCKTRTIQKDEPNG